MLALGAKRKPRRIITAHGPARDREQRRACPFCFASFVNGYGPPWEGNQTRTFVHASLLKAARQSETKTRFESWNMIYTTPWHEAASSAQVSLGRTTHPSKRVLRMLNLTQNSGIVASLYLSLSRLRGFSVYVCVLLSPSVAA